MNVETMLEVLRRDFGINSREEFETACKKFQRTGHWHFYDTGRGGNRK